MEEADFRKGDFTTAYITRLTSGTGTTATNGYHGAANAIDADDTLNNIETTLNHELSNLQLANNAHHQSTAASVAALRADLAAIQQQLAMLSTAPAAVPPPATYAAAAAPPPAPTCIKHWASLMTQSVNRPTKAEKFTASFKRRKNRTII